MCVVAVVPIIGAVIGAASAIAGGVVQAEAGKGASEEAARQAAEQAAAAAANRTIRQKQGQDALVRGSQEAALYEKKGREIASAANAQLSAAGNTAASDFAAQAIYLAGLDARRARADAAREAWFQVEEGENFARAEAGFKRRGEAELRAGYLGQIGVGLQTGASVAQSATSGALKAYEMRNYA